MSGTAERVFFDTCTLENFSVAGRLDLLRSLYGDRCAWMMAVAEEVLVRVAERTGLVAVDKTWLGEPIEVNDPLTLKRVDLIRRTLGGLSRSATRPT